MNNKTKATLVSWAFEADKKPTSCFYDIYIYISMYIVLIKIHVKYVLKIYKRKNTEQMMSKSGHDDATLPMVNF